MDSAELLGKVLERSENVVFRKVADQALLVPIRASAANLDAIFGLNLVAERIWDLLDGTRTGKEILEVIVREFDVSAETAEADLLKFLGELIRCGVVESTGSEAAGLADV